VSRPTNTSKYEAAERWMTETFGQKMQDYVSESRAEPASVAVVEVAKLLRKAKVSRLLDEWKTQDAKSAAGCPAIYTPADALTLLLYQLRMKRNTLITEMGDTLLALDKTHAKILGLHHDGHDKRVYDRIWSAILRLIRLVDEFPGRRDKKLTEAEFNAVLDARDPADCQQKRERMFTLANTLLEGSRQLLPQEVLDRHEGNVAMDATFIPLYGKAGNPSSRNRTGKRRSANYDGGWYRRDGSHGAVTHADAVELKKADPKAKHHARSKSKLFWGIETEITRMTANFREKEDLFPKLTTAISFHIPGEVRGEGYAMVESLHHRGHRINMVIVDRAYNNGLHGEYAVPIRLLGGKHVFSYRDEDLGEQAYDARGFIQVSGTWYLDTLPQVLRDADKPILAARNKYKAVDADADRKAPARALAAAEKLYASQLSEREKYMLRPKGRMDDDWTRRYLLPTHTAEYKKWRTRPNAHQGQTLMMKRPTGKEALEANAGGLKHEQYFPYGTEDWTAANGLRNGVESVNRNIKRSQYEDIADPDKRAVRGNTFTYLVAALATVVENLRQIISFYKRQLAVVTYTAKNKNLPSTFWQSASPADQEARKRQPPG
jgi:hypothetical protein